MNPTALGGHLAASRGIRVPFAFVCRNRNTHDRSSAYTSRAVLGKACSPTPLKGRQYLIQKKCTRHCNRRIHDGPSGSSSPTFSERLGIGNWKRNGTPELAVGSIILVLVGIDYILQARNDQQREDVYKQLGREVRRDEATTRREEKILNEGVAANPKFKCIVRKVPQNFDGHKCLTNLKIGDIVNVIEEGVGPGGQYNLCSIVRTAKNGGSDSSGNVSIGWFPCSCLQKIE